MANTRKKKINRVYQSIEEFEKAYLPRQNSEKTEGKSTEPPNEGTGLTKELLKTLQQQLTK